MKQNTYESSPFGMERSQTFKTTSVILRPGCKKGFVTQKTSSAPKSLPVSFQKLSSIASSINYAIQPIFWSLLVCPNCPKDKRKQNHSLELNTLLTRSQKYLQSHWANTQSRLSQNLLTSILLSQSKKGSMIMIRQPIQSVSKTFISSTLVTTNSVRAE